jgi:sulfopyruvate decarboxylase subunit alpha
MGRAEVVTTAEGTMRLESTEPPPRLEEAESLHGQDIITALKRARVEYVLSVPDLHTSHNLLYPISRDADLRLIRVCKEDECLGIATGLSYGDKRAIILIQYTGFLYAMNAIRALACEQSQPMCLMVGLLNHKGGTARNSRRLGLRIIEPILDSLGIPYHLVDTDADIERIAPAISEAYERRHPVAFLIARSPI